MTLRVSQSSRVSSQIAACADHQVTAHRYPDRGLGLALLATGRGATGLLITKRVEPPRVDIGETLGDQTRSVYQSGSGPAPSLPGWFR